MSSSIESPGVNPTPPTGPPPADASVGDLVKAMSADLSRLVRYEIQLAQTEISAKIKTAGIGVGAFGGAGVLAFYGLGVLIAAAVLGLALVLPAWLAAVDRRHRGARHRRCGRPDREEEGRARPDRRYPSEPWPA